MGRSPASSASSCPPSRRKGCSSSRASTATRSRGSTRSQSWAVARKPFIRSIGGLRRRRATTRCSGRRASREASRGPASRRRRKGRPARPSRPQSKRGAPTSRSSPRRCDARPRRRPRRSRRACKAPWSRTEAAGARKKPPWWISSPQLRRASIWNTFTFTATTMLVMTMAKLPHPCPSALQEWAPPSRRRSTTLGKRIAEGRGQAPSTCTRTWVCCWP
mmetsp:Transcript_18332/g.38030  ORF Transcript_18332/g.38030 Transcript_18332/m.38030 type:complete len:219 (-) Transcript_18332:2246-2902(-)